MNKSREIRLMRCGICGEEFDELTMHEIFTSRRQHICNSCYNRGNRQIDAKNKDWRRSAKGKTIIEYLNRHK